jgi:hypothetical protein
VQDLGWACVLSLIAHSHGKLGLAVPHIDVELVAVQCAIPYPLGIVSSGCDVVLCLLVHAELGSLGSQSNE